jgi:hypothetical protein
MRRSKMAVRRVGIGTYIDEDDEEEQEEKVARCLACPACGERRMDQLEWNSYGTEVTCASCGSVYDPNA